VKAKEGLYQIEIKYHVVKKLFNPNVGWEVLVDIDPMERGKGRYNTDAKRKICEDYYNKLVNLGVNIGKHQQYGRVDIFARKGYEETHLVEVEGYSSRQIDQALFSALGQLLLYMNNDFDKIEYGLAIPNTHNWTKYIDKIPFYIREKLRINLYKVDNDGVEVVNYWRR
jgi:hypothetical protein